MTSHSSGTETILTVTKRDGLHTDNTKWFKHLFASRTKNALALFFVVAVLSWALVVPVFRESLIHTVLGWLQPYR